MRRIARSILGFFVATVLLSGLVTAPVLAGDNCAPDGIGGFAFPTWHKYLETSAPPACEIESFEIPGDVWKVGLAVVEMVLRIAGLVAMIFVIYAGFKYVLSRGNPSEAAKARQTIIDAVIGIGIASIATVLVGFLGSRLTQ
jgi:cbb3-type cytochrome oxidase subunit 3